MLTSTRLYAPPGGQGGGKKEEEGKKKGLQRLGCFTYRSMTGLSACDCGGGKKEGGGEKKTHAITCQLVANRLVLFYTLTYRLADKGREGKGRGREKKGRGNYLHVQCL